jgi:3-dehydroquinate synthase
MLPSHIKITDNPGPFLRLFLQKWGYHKIMVLADDNTARHCYPLLQDTLPEHHLLKVPSGEEHKNLTTCETIWSAMTEQALDRHSMLVILGGGVLGDMGGFCAATYKRGIDFTLLPTTLLAMADASIGGKLGIDFQGFKNHIGLFQEPKLNILFPGFLKTLPPSELRSGFAEVIKHALISDKVLWNELHNTQLEDQSLESLIRHSAEFKSSVTQQDPTEKGLRKTLNAGHTIGHAIETFFLRNKSAILHGDAVAAGLVCEAFLAREENLLTENELHEISEYITGVYGKLPLQTENFEGIAALCIQDKKNKDNKILTVLLEGIGQARWDCAITMDRIVASLNFYRDLQT